MAQRFNLYAFHHKALRYFFGEISTLCGSTNFENKNEVEFLKERMLKLMSLLASHSFIEDQVILKELEKTETTFSDKDTHDHLRLDAIVFKIISGLQSLNNETENLTFKGNNLYLLFTQLHGEYLIHMHQEEVNTLPIILKAFNDEELNSLKAKIFEKTPPKLMYDWFQFSLPALNQSERIEALKPIMQKSSDDIIAHTLSLAKNTLSENEFESVIKGLDLQVV